jgi:type VI secretion system protein ImpL
MKAFFKRAFGWLANRWVISIIGIILLALLIWFGGPLIAIAGAEPLVSPTARIISILSIVLIWLVSALVRTARSHRTNSGMVEQLTDPKNDVAAAGSDEEATELRNRFREAMATLRKAKLGGRRGRRLLYQLPWFLIIGPPGAGKTTALLNSGLVFPLKNKMGDSPVRGVGGTRNCDWWFTDEAVLLDTAGRYMTQDSSEPADRAAWEKFLGLLKRHRRWRPLDGVIVAISITDLLQGNQEVIERHAAATRTRLQEIYNNLKIKPPVYVLLTKVDLIAGFSEFFDALGRDQRGQVWGTTFDLDQSHDPQSISHAFDLAFDSLLERLDAQRIDRVESERDFSRRTLIFGFPQETAALKAPVRAFLDAAFAPSRFDDQSFVRGVYFSSGTQEGTPIDRVIGAVSRTFGLDRRAQPALSGLGRSFFLTRLFRDVVFQEVDAVGPRGFMDKYGHWLERVGFLGAAAAAGILILGIWTSYGRNQAFVGSVNAALDQQEAKTAEIDYRDGNVDDILRTLSGLRDLPRGYTAREDSIHLLSTFGLYQGDKLGGAAQTAYRRGLNALLMPMIGDRLQERIINSQEDPVNLYRVLRTYLMLADPTRLEKDDVVQVVVEDWDVRYPGPENAARRTELRSHLGALLDGPFAALQADPGLVQQTRDALRENLSIPERVYGLIKAQGITASEAAPPWRITDHLTTADLSWFRRESRRPWTAGVPGFFTRRGYSDIFLLSSLSEVDAATAENWVLQGEVATETSLLEQGRLARQIGDLYFEDYIRTWQTFLDDIAIAPFLNLEQGMEVTRVLSSPASPLKKLLTAVTQQTQLAGASAAATAASAAESTRGIGKKFADFLGAGGEAIVRNDPAIVVDNHFASLNRLVASADGQPPPIDSALTPFSDLNRYLSSIALSSNASQQALTITAENAERGGGAITQVEQTSQRQPDPVRKWMQSVAQQSSSLTVGQARDRIRAAWRTTAAPECRAVLAGRYPAAAAATSDVRLRDFGKFFGEGGTMDTFFDQFLRPLTDTSIKPWRWVRTAGTPIGLPNGSLTRFQDAKDIQEAFFANGGTSPAVRFEIEPDELDLTVRQVQLVLGDDTVRFFHGPRRRILVSWPPQNSLFARVELTLAESGRTIGLSEQGVWAMFRLFDQADMQSVGGRDQFVAVFDLEGHKASFRIDANSILNPFRLPQLRRFNCSDRL